jgi:hypothetical protein
MTVEKLDLKFLRGNKEVEEEIGNQENSGYSKEKILLEDIKILADEYQEVNKVKNQFIKILEKNIEKLDFSEYINNAHYSIKEKKIKTKMQSGDISGLKIVSVDGSSVIKKFLNVDFSFLKAIAVRYHFSKNYSAKIHYFPDISGYNNYQIKGNYYNREENIIDTKLSMDLRILEIKLLNKLIEEFPSIDLIILDGSIVPMPINYIFSNDPEITSHYNRLTKEHQNLYYNCMENNILLIGSIKDSRTTAFCNHLKNSIMYLKPNHRNLKDFIEINYRKVLSYFTDINLFHKFLNVKERSAIFVCKKEINKLRDQGFKKDISFNLPLSFYAFYLKTVPYDTPCRIEFFIDEKHKFEDATRKANLISSIFLPLSSYNKYYGLPIPQIEAHKRAVFKSGEINIFFNNLKRTLTKYGINLIEKRRNRRPF